MPLSFRFGIGDESIKWVKGNQSRANLPGKAVYSQRHIHLTSAKRDDASFQVFIESDEEFVLSMTNHTVFHPQIELPVIRMKATTNATGVEIQTRIEGFIEDDDCSMKADLLLHDDTVTVPKLNCQPVWIDVNIPDNFAALRIDGEISFHVHRLFEDEQLAGQLSFSIDVMEVLMPLPKDFHFYLDLWQHSSNLSRAHAVPLWSDEHFAIMESYLKSLAEIGQKVITVIVSEVPWAGQYCFDVKSHLSNLFEYSMIPVEKDQYGRLQLDFSILDRYIQTCLSLGIDKEIEVIGLVNIWCREGSGFERLVSDYPDAIRIRYYDQKDGAFKYCRERRELIEYIHLLECHFADMGWINIVRIMADEPMDTDQYWQSIQAVKSAAPRFKFKAAINHTSFIQSFRGDIDDFVMLVGCMLREWDDYRSMKAEGDGRYLWYTCCGITPDSCIRAALLESRFIGWLTAYLGLEGFLRWNYTVWPENPRQTVYWNAPIFPAGETCFVYPGENGKPVLSMRFMHLRRGIRDFELIRMVQDRCPNPEKLLESVFGRIILSADITKSGLGEGGPAKTEDIICLKHDSYEASRRELLTLLSTDPEYGR